MIKFLHSVGVDMPPVVTTQALKTACINGRVEVIKFLCSIGADIHDDNDYAIRRACTTDRFGIGMIETLYSLGANIHADNEHAIRMASYYGKLEVVQFLHSVGANIHVNDERPLRSASRGGHLNVVKYLHQAGADISALDGNALQLAIAYNRRDVVSFFQSLRAAPQLDTNDKIIATSIDHPVL
jgi:ankyrin repeat protein